MLIIKRINVLSFAKLLAVAQAILGLLMGAVVLLIGVLSPQSLPEELQAGGFGEGVIALLIFPLANGLLGGISGAVGAYIYNFAARLGFGITIDVEESSV